MEKISIFKEIQEWLNLTNGIITFITFIIGGAAGYKLKSIIIKNSNQKNSIKKVSGSGNKIEQKNINNQ